MPNLDITFRTDELTAREMQIAVNLNRNYDPLLQIEFILLRATPDTPDQDGLAAKLWMIFVSELSALYNSALSAGMEPTLAAMQKAQEEAEQRTGQSGGWTVPPARRTPDPDFDIFQRATDEGLQM